MSGESRQTEYQFNIIKNASDFDWKSLEKAEDYNVFFTLGWEKYLAELGKKCIIITVSSGGNIVGYFIGSKLWAGIKIVMAPFMGTGTYTQGLCMIEPVSELERINIYRQLAAWLFKKNHAAYLQVCDLHIREERQDWDWETKWPHELLDKEGIHYTPRYTFLLDVNKTEEELWNSCHSNIRRYVNRGKKEGLTVRVVEREEDIESFIDIHYQHIQDMLGRKNTYGLLCQRRKNMSFLCHSLFPNHVLMLQVIGKDEKGDELSLASCIFAYGKAGSTFFTGASFHEYMNRHPNELMMWEVMRRLSERKAGVINLGGTADYKKKLGPTYALIPVLSFTKYKFMNNFYTTTKKIYGKLTSLLLHFK